MKMIKRKQLFGLLAALTLVASAPWAHAQSTYPSKPIRLVVPYSPGGGTDILARLVGEKLQSRMGQAVVVDNKPGGNTAIASRLVGDSPADGYTLLLVSTAFASVPAGNASLFDPSKFTTIGRLSNILLVLVVNANLPMKNVQELVTYAKANPGKLTYATSSIGGSDHLAGELFNLRAGTNIRSIPYKGAAPAVNDLLGGTVDMRWDAMPSSRPHIESGKLRALGVAELKRSSMAPQIPTIAEQGVPGFEIPGFYGVVGPAGLPRDVVTKLNRELNEVIKLPDVRAKMQELGLDPIGSTPEEFGAYVKDNVELWTKVIKDAGIKVE